ncbi:hypothetical protein [Nocardioides sp.]|uniref:hypothetical protein n=1 Tax=Nocardioides sp. TaxID=35761 RepID=UPI0035B4E5C2
MSTPGTMSELEERLRAALTARAELVRSEDLAPLTPVVELRPRWRSPWVLLATAAVVLLVLGVVLQGVGRDQRSDDLAPEPDQQVTLPPDVGGSWTAAEAATPAKVDLDGDGTLEKVTYRAEPSEDYTGRLRLETTLSSTGEETYGVTDLGSTLGTTPLDPIDADGDGDQELVLLHELDPDAVGGHSTPVLFDLREGLLVEVVPEDPDLLQRVVLGVPGSETEHYDLAVIHHFWFEDGQLHSGRSLNSYARGNMSLYRPERVALESWVWRLDEDGVLRADEAGCRLEELGEIGPCGGQTEDDPLEVGAPTTELWGVGDGGDIAQGYPFSVRLEPGVPPSLVLVGMGGRTIRHEVDLADPQVAAAQPWGATYDGMSVLLTSASDPDAIQLLVEDGEQLAELRAVGDVPFGNGTTADGRSYRSWMTDDGVVVTATSLGDDQWEIWGWQLLRGLRMTAMPRGVVCLADIDDPASGC